MGCNCKNKKKLEDKEITNQEVVVNNKKSESIFIASLNYGLRFMMFVLTTIISMPIVTIFTIYMLFRTLVLNKNIDVTGILFSIGKLIQKRNIEKDVDDKDEDEDEWDVTLYDGLEDEDFSNIIETEDITVEKK